MRGWRKPVGVRVKGVVVWSRVPAGVDMLTGVKSGEHFFGDGGVGEEVFAHDGPDALLVDFGFEEEDVVVEELGLAHAFEEGGWVG